MGMFKNKCTRKTKLRSKFERVIDIMVAKYDNVSVILTGHSLGGALSAMIYNDWEKSQKYQGILKGNYSYNPYISKRGFISKEAYRVWSEILSSPSQTIVGIDGDFAWKGLRKVVTADQKAMIHVITGLGGKGDSTQALHDTMAFFTPVGCRIRTEAQMHALILTGGDQSVAEKINYKKTLSEVFTGNRREKMVDLVKHHTSHLTQNSKERKVSVRVDLPQENVPTYLTYLMKS